MLRVWEPLLTTTAAWADVSAGVRIVKAASKAIKDMQRLLNDIADSQM